MLKIKDNTPLETLNNNCENISIEEIYRILCEKKEYVTEVIGERLKQDG